MVSQNHYNLHRHRRRLSFSKRRSSLDHFMFLVALSSPAMTVPQIYDIWIKKNILGVSLLTWGAFGVISIIWIIYALVHKDKPILFNSVGALIVDCLIVAGVLIFK